MSELNGTTPCAIGITISQVNRARMTAIHRGIMILFRGLDLDIPDVLIEMLVALPRVEFANQPSRDYHFAGNSLFGTR